MTTRFQRTLEHHAVDNGYRVTVADLDLDPLTLGALGDNPRAYAEGFMTGFYYRQVLDDDN